MKFFPSLFINRICHISAIMLLTFLLLFAHIQTTLADDVFAEQLFINGNIITVDDITPRAQAVAVSKGVIIAVGNTADIFKYRDSDTETIDLKGQTLLPGFIDIHTHPILSAMMSETVDISGFTHKNQQEVFASIKTALADKDEGEWLIAYGWDPAILRDLQNPSLAQLDVLAPNNPVFIISQTLHSAFANSLAFEQAGITKHSKNPDGAYFEKDENGELTGLIVEVNAMQKFSRVTPKYPQSAYLYLLTKQFERYARAGYTTIVAPGLQSMFPEYIALFQAAAEHDDSQLRTFIYPMVNEFEKNKFNRATVNNKNLSSGSSLHSKILGPKLWIDGSPYAGGMAINEPYLDNEFTRQKLSIPSGSNGHLTYNNKQLYRLVEKYHRQGWQISAHVQGERAAEQFLNAIETTLSKYPRADHRHRMEHNALVTAEQFQRAFTLGITVSFYIDHIYYYGDTLKELIVGDQRANRFMAINSAKKAGHHITLHTDSPSSPLGVLREMRVAISRFTRSKKYQLGIDEVITIDDAIKAVTINAAWQIFEEHSRGSIEIGKLADFTVLSNDLYSTPVDNWSDIEIVDTYLAGQLVINDGWSWRKVELIAATAWAMLFE